MLPDAILCVTRLIFFALIHLGASPLTLEARTLSPARDSAFRLLCLFLIAELEYETKSRRKIYNADFFVVSHHAISKLYVGNTEKFHMSKKQRANLNTLPVLEPGTGDA